MARHAHDASSTPAVKAGARSPVTDDWPFVPVMMSRPQEDARQKMAQRIQHFCTLRQDSFGGIIHDAPFNILMALYLGEYDARRFTVGDACRAAGAPQTTALRAIQALVDAGSVERFEDPADHRCKRLALTPRGRDRLARFMDRFAASDGL